MRFIMLFNNRYMLVIAIQYYITLNLLIMRKAPSKMLYNEKYCIINN